jgi:formylglycine-generating enzyme required for sulfatase activity
MNRMNFSQTAALLRFALILGAVCATLLVHAPRSSAQDPEVVDAVPGLVSTKPVAGDFIPATGVAAGQFMVPYAVTLPGSSIRFDMVPVPSGKFQLGSPTDEAGRQEDEGPQTTVEVSAFWMATCEVTWAEYKHFMNLYGVLKSQPRAERIVHKETDTGTFTVPTPLYDSSFTFALGDEPQQPAVSMTQYSAKQYTKWLTAATGTFFRLPTEAEWEYACRAGTTSRFSFGDDESVLGDYAWFYDNSDDTYHEVGKKKPNPWGLFDMHGNVGEMVLDQFKADAYASIQDRPAPSFVAATKKVFDRVVRGGAWDQDAAELRSAARDKTEDWRVEDPNFPKSPWWFTDEESLCVGFRVIRPLEAPPIAERDKFFAADVKNILMDVENRLEEGRGVVGAVDPRGDKPSTD